MTDTRDGTQRLWWQEGVVYQIYPRSFQDSSGDGIGDLRGITNQLHYLGETLGVDAIWLSPFYPSPMADFGYDISNYTDVNPLFGDLADFDALLGEAHERGMHIIIDYVPNHTSDQHPWFLESRSSREAPKRNWYIWRDPGPDGGPPNNWLSIFGGGAWEWDESTGQYYLHSFLKEQPDLNWRNPEVERAMLDVLRFWLERGVDGFRIDVATLIMKDPELRDNPPNPDVRGRIRPMRDQSVPAEVVRPYDMQLHVYDHSHPDVHEEFRKIRKLLDEYSVERPRVTIGEIHEPNWTKWVGYYGARLDEIHLPFNFSMLWTPWEAAAVRASVDAMEGALPEGAWPNHVLGNHDEHRIASRVGPAQARVAMTLLLTLRGTPTVYYGDEIGMRDVPIPPDRVQDPWEKREPDQGFGRDPERSPMQWDGGPNAGFCPPGVESWLPVAQDYREVNVEVEMEDARSMLALTRALLRMRRNRPALNLGSYRPMDSTPSDCYVYLREADEQRMLVVLNFSDSGVTLALPDLGKGWLELSTHMDRSEEVDLTSLSLRGNEGCVIALDAGGARPGH